ncbi:hypothetical protein B0T24DRAFT_509 [Lasiosphaeria ovina]|uniref:Zn(2)-C6 fungal-type domain-containing protein n=1 Tax=Lasiosphaeria ovina TaxID=92902 RepID=A0AAE0NIH8_9PEZI|nr:hypothetical protein B0T24DRAFT_509 [Lasiosphaeria ovina]
MTHLTTRGQDSLGPVPTDLPSLALSLHCFQFQSRATPALAQAHTPLGRHPRTKAKLTPQEKEKVSEVRRRRACLRCRVLKIQCSNGNPCQPCLRSAVKGVERKVLSFCYCVRTRFSDVNIFLGPAQAEAAVSMQLETVLSRMSGLLARIATPAEFTFNSSPENFNETLVSWLMDPAFNLPDGSIVGLCCSSLLSLQFRDEAGGGDGFITEFRRFLLATSLVHSGWHGDRNIRQRDLCAVSHMSGHRLMKQLDRVLTPQFLAKCGRESCQVLFLMVLGVVLAVGYSSAHTTDSPTFPPQMLSVEFQQSPTLWLVMKEHLCQMLAHHLIFLGSLLGIRLETGLEQRLIDTAARRWNKMEAYAWADATGLSENQELGYASSSGSCPIRSSVRHRGPKMAHEEDENTQYWEEPPPAPPASDPPPPFIPIHLPEAAQFQPQYMDQWSENPQSYLSMTDEPESYYTEPSVPEEPGQGMSTPLPKAYTEPTLRQNGPALPREVKRRSMWVVRTVDAGPERGHINVRARLRGSGQSGGFRSFV